jgi:hypothetical protein
VRVAPDDLMRASAVLAVLDGPGSVTTSVAEPGWLSVRVTPDRTGDVNRVLGEAGIWATGLESGNDLEMLFLGLTGGNPVPGGEGTFFGMAGVGPDSSSTSTGEGDAA